MITIVRDDVDRLPISLIRPDLAVIYTFLRLLAFGYYFFAV